MCDEYAPVFCILDAEKGQIDGYSTHPVRTVTDFGHASHLKWPKSEAKRLSYGNFGTEITYLCTVTMDDFMGR